MTCIDKFKHVCFGDLDNYVKRDNYFSDYTLDEIDTVRRNLGFSTTLSEFNLIYSTYENILTRMNQKKLNLSCLYIINDFRTLYKDKDGNVCGTDDFLPSLEYKIILRPSSTSSFDRKVFLLSDEQDTSKWEVEYDIKKEKLSSTISTKGKITYMKDLNNNSAYYDFKNIRFKRTLEELKIGSNSYKEDTYLYTFTRDGDNIELSSVYHNVTLGPGCTNNVFLRDSRNVSLIDSSNNTFFTRVVNSSLTSSGHNYFKDTVNMCECKKLNYKTLGSITARYMPKYLLDIGGILVVKYIDNESLTEKIEVI